MADDRNHARELDGEVLGEQVGDGSLPGVNEFVDIGPMSSEDPALLQGGSETEDDLRTREWRERADGADSVDDDAVALLAPDEQGAGAPDTEQQLLAQTDRPLDGVIDPEDAAMQIVDDA